MWWRLQPYVVEAVTLCGGGCNPTWRRLQPYVEEAATLCDCCTVTAVSACICTDLCYLAITPTAGPVCLPRHLHDMMHGIHAHATCDMRPATCDLRVCVCVCVCVRWDDAWCEAWGPAPVAPAPSPSPSCPPDTGTGRVDG